MPKKLSPEEATVMIIRRRLQQMEEAKMAGRENAVKRTAANDDDIGSLSIGSVNNGSLNTGSLSSGSSNIGSPGVESGSTGKELPKE